MQTGYRILRADGTEIASACWIHEGDVSGTRETLKRLMAEVLGPDAGFERVRVLWDGKERDLFVDEMGHPKGLSPNRQATIVYRSAMVQHDPLVEAREDMPWIAGDAVLFDRSFWR